MKKEEDKQLSSWAAKLECQKDLKFHNEQCLNSPKVGWGFYPNNIAAFTLPEIILTIGIIGIIAALTIPQLIQNSNNKELVSAFLKSNNVLANAYKNAKAIDNIQKMGVEDFKSTFKKYLKTYDCNNHDICLQDGMFIDFECDEEKCSSLTVDTNGAKRPNQDGKDLFAFDITPDKIIPKGEQEQCSGLDCGMYTLTYHKIFDGLIGNCKTYEAGNCTTCKDGFHLENNKCSQIQMNTCDKFNGENCTKCKSDYILTSGDCINKDTLNCETKSSTKEECSVCKSDYYLKNSVCSEKPSYCKSISNDGSQCTLKNNKVASRITLEDGTDRFALVSTEETQTLSGAESFCSQAGLNIPSFSDATKIYNVKNNYSVLYTEWIYTTETCGSGCTKFIYFKTNDFWNVESASAVSLPKGSSGRYVLCVGN